MSARIHVRAGERGRVWVFSVDIGPAEIDPLLECNGTSPLQEALGADTLDSEHVEVFPVSDLEGVGLSGYLSEGHGIPEDQLADMRARLDAQTGVVMVLTSRALGGTEQTLTPRAPLRLLASFSEERRPVSFEPLPSGETRAETRGGKPAPSEAALMGRVATVVLLVLFALVAVMIWIAA